MLSTGVRIRTVGFGQGLAFLNHPWTAFQWTGSSPGWSQTGLGDSSAVVRCCQLSGVRTDSVVFSFHFFHLVESICGYPMQIRHILDDSTKYATAEDTILHMERLK